MENITTLRMKKVLGKNEYTVENVMNKLSELAGGKNIGDMIADGQIVNADGTSFFLPDPDDEEKVEVALTEIMEAARVGGIYVYPDPKEEEPKPYLFTVDNTTGELKRSERTVSGYSAEQAGKMIADKLTFSEAPVKPGVGNRIMDWIRRKVFRMEGTPEMNEYRELKEQYKNDMEEKRRYTEIGETLKGHAEEMRNDAWAKESSHKHVMDYTRYLMNRKREYEVAKLPASDAGNGLDELRKDAPKRLFDIVDAGTKTHIKEPEKVKGYIAAVVALDLVMMERKGREKDPKIRNKDDNGMIIAGPLETALNKNKEAFIESVEGNTKFMEIVGEPTPKSICNFIDNNGSRDICDAIIKEAAKMKAAQSGGNEKVLGSAKENEGKNMEENAPEFEAVSNNSN